MRLFYGQDNKVKLWGTVWPHLLRLWSIPCPADGKLVCMRCACTCICWAKRQMSSWKDKHSHKNSAQNNKVAMCTRALWIWLYFPLFPVSPPCLLHRLIFTLITALSFHRPHSFGGSTHTECVCFLHLSFLPSLPWCHLDFDQHHIPPHLFPLSCSYFAIHLSSSPMHLMSLYLCSSGFLPYTSLSFLIVTHAHIPALANEHHLVLYCSFWKQRLESKSEF